MSFQAMAWAVKQKVGNATGKAILIMLANYADEKGECFPSQEQLSTECECSVATVARWIRSFEELGFLTRRKQYGEGGYRRADRLCISTDLPVTKLPSKELDNSASKLTRQKAGAEPIKEPRSSLRSDKPREVSQFDELAVVLDEAHARAVVDHRKTFRAHFTPYAARLLARKFARCPDPNAAADAMICNGWQGFEPEWLDRQHVRGSPAAKKPTIADAFGRVAELAEYRSDARRSESFGSVQSALPHLPRVSDRRS